MFIFVSIFNLMLSRKQINTLKNIRQHKGRLLIRYGERCDNFFIDYATKGDANATIYTGCYYVRAYYNINGNLKSKVYCRYYDFIQGKPACVLFKTDLKLQL